MSYLEEQIKKLGYISYEHYLRTKRWKEFRDKVKKKACLCCDSEEYLQVHHISYQNLGDEKEEDVITVCGNCHQIIHEICKDRVSPLITAHIELKDNLSRYKSVSKYVKGKLTIKKSRKKKHKKPDIKKTQKKPIIEDPNNAAIKMGYSSFNEYLETDHWADCKFYYQDNKCFCCGEYKDLDIKHTTYNTLGKESKGDVKTLCKLCLNGIDELLKKGIKLTNAHMVLRDMLSTAKTTFTKKDKDKRKKKKKVNSGRKPKKGNYKAKKLSKDPYNLPKTKPYSKDDKPTSPFSF